MKKRIIIGVSIVALAVLPIMNPHYVYAYNNEITQTAYANTELLRGDVIVTKYRLHNGYYQYRHWNETQGCWVEDHWITIA
ncbi:MAG: hypothetical protein K6B68_11870 [Eubacterium sp.]|nr:hypothetical protein [Eubacterium sp.]